MTGLCLRNIRCRTGNECFARAVGENFQVWRRKLRLPMEAITACASCIIETWVNCILTIDMIAVLTALHKTPLVLPSLYVSHANSTPVTCQLASSVFNCSVIISFICRLLQVAISRSRLIFPSTSFPRIFGRADKRVFLTTAKKTAFYDDSIIFRLRYFPVKSLKP